MQHIATVIPRPLESTDFRVQRTDAWIRMTAPCGIIIYESPTGDIWEYAEGDYAWSQLFTYDAAVRETSTARKRLPTAEEWNDIIRFINPDIDLIRSRQSDTYVRKVLWLRLLGGRNETFATFGNCGVYGNYWSSTRDTPYIRTVLFSHDEITPANHPVHPKRGLPIRCLVNDC